MRPGTFIRTKLGRDHLTLWVEGRDRDEPSVAALALNLESLDLLIRRLGNVRQQLGGRR